MIEVGRNRASMVGQRVGAIGLPHKGCIAVGLGIEGDDLYFDSLLRAQTLHRANAAHRGFSAIHDGESSNLRQRDLLLGDMLGDMLRDMQSQASCRGEKVKR